ICIAGLPAGREVCTPSTVWRSAPYDRGPAIPGRIFYACSRAFVISMREVCVPVQWCGGWDLNPRTPTGQGPEPCAFDLSWQPPRERKKESAFDKCLSCFGRVPAGKIRPTFDPVSDRIILNQLSGQEYAL